MRLILASASPVRAALLRAAGVPFEAVPARIDEDAVKETLLARKADAQEIAGTLAELKAKHVSAIHPGALVLGADQVLAFESGIVSKAADLGAAAELLRRLRGKAHRQVTAAVLTKDGTEVWRHTVSATLVMRAFGDAFLEDYLTCEGPVLLNSVGCYRLEGRGVRLFARIDGDYFGILGLPLVPLLTALGDRGIIAA